jgi:hypothetical protein
MGNTVTASGPRNCRAAEIQRFAENAPRWADVSKSIAPFA